MIPARNLIGGPKLVRVIQINARGSCGGGRFARLPPSRAMGKGTGFRSRLPARRTKPNALEGCSRAICRPPDGLKHPSPVGCGGADWRARVKVDAPGIIGGGAAPKGVADMSLYRRLAALGLTGLKCFPQLVSVVPGSERIERYQQQILAALTPAEAEAWH
jgi:hypothetical protein